MATQQISNFSNALANDNALRTKVAQIKQALIDAGLTLDDDTGQVDASILTIPGAGNASVGFNIFRFNDALQSDLPVYIRIDYIVQSIANPSPTLHLGVTVGTDTNGAGTIAGQKSPSNSLYGTTSNLTANLYISADDDRLALHWGGGQSGLWTILVSRTYDPDGTPTDDGIVLLYANSSSTARCQLVPKTGAVPGSQLATDCFGNVRSFGSSATVTDIALGSMPVPIKATWKYTLACLYYATDATAFDSFEVNFLGANRTFLALGVSITNGVGAPNWGTGSNNALAMPWE